MRSFIDTFDFLVRIGKLREFFFMPTRISVRNFSVIGQIFVGKKEQSHINVPISAGTIEGHFKGKTPRRVKVTKHGRREIFLTRPDRPWGPHSILYEGYHVIPGVKRPGRGFNHPLLLSSAEVIEGVELRLLSPTFPVPLWHFTG